MKYIINLLGQTLLMLFLGNLCLVFVPKSIRKVVKSACKTLFKISKYSYSMLSKALKFLLVSSIKTYKEMNKVQTKKETKPSVPDNVIDLKSKVSSK